VRRRLFTFASAASLLLCIGALIGWGCGGGRGHTFHIINSGATILDLRVWHGDFVYYGPPQAMERWVIQSPSVQKSTFQFMGQTSLTVACWKVVALLAFLPSIWLCLSRKKATSANDCRDCGYNLTGNTSGVCPECGTAVKSV
jgi:hypothetical protein